MDKKLPLTINELKIWYNKFNTLFFFGGLPMVNHIHFLEDSSLQHAAGYTFINNRNNYMSPKVGTYPEDIYYAISFNPESDFSVKTLLSCLCHEMIHIWQWEEIDFAKYSGNYGWMNGHNKTFIGKMRNINLLAKDYDIDIEVGLTYKD